jgi:outer membrane protein TolC
LNYGRLVNGIRVQDARFEELAVTYQNLVLQANAEVENGVTRFLNAQQQVKFLAASTRAAEQSVQLVRSQYDAGKTDFNRVLVVEQALAQQQDQLALAEGSVVQNLVDIYKALGGGWQIRLDNAANPTAAVIAQPTALVPAPAQ